MEVWKRYKKFQLVSLIVLMEKLQLMESSSKKPEVCPESFLIVPQSLNSPLNPLPSPNPAPSIIWTRCGPWAPFLQSKFILEQASMTPNQNQQPRRVGQMWNWSVNLSRPPRLKPVPNHENLTWTPIISLEVSPSLTIRKQVLSFVLSAMIHILSNAGLICQ